MKKALTYSRYFWDYLKNGDIGSIIASVNYLTNKTSHRTDRIITTSLGIFHCRKNTNDFQFANYYYEWSVKKFLLKHRKEFSIFIDGGSCIGDYCILLSHFNIRCIAFEPVKSNFAQLTRNIELNDLETKIAAFPVGLGAHNALAKFFFNPVNTGASHLTHKNNPDGCEVEICTFDSLVSALKINKDENILFKLDIEGMEVEAIQGAQNFIRDFPNITFVIENKLTGKDSIKEILSKFATFKFGTVDEFNIYATKLSSN